MSAQRNLQGDLDRPGVRVSCAWRDRLRREEMWGSLKPSMLWLPEDKLPNGDHDRDMALATFRTHRQGGNH